MPSYKKRDRLPQAVAAGHRPMSPLRPPTTMRAPGVSFCNYVLVNFHALTVPASRGSRTEPDAAFWLVSEAGTPLPSADKVKNALNFCFSSFVVAEIYARVYSAVATHGNIARFIVSRGCCKLGPILFAPKISTRPIRLTPPVRSVSLNGLTGGASCS
jgi:hypothetical protein